MKMYWGSSRKAGCDTIACRPGHITFNTELAKLPRRYIEYIVVHELVHHLTDGHDARFYELMDKHVPGWRAMQARIEEPRRRYSGVISAASASGAVRAIARWSRRRCGPSGRARRR